MTLNKKHFDYFTKKVYHYINLFELNDWKINIEFIDTHKEYLNSFVNKELENGFATIYLIKNNYRSDNKDIFKDLSETAKHETIHLLLEKLSSLTYDRYVLQDVIYNEIEYLTRKLTRLLPDK